MESTRELAASRIRKAQHGYKANFDRKAMKDLRLRVGDWMVVHFPQGESGRERMLSRPWHEPYRVTSVSDPDVSVIKVYFPEDGAIQIHQSRVKVSLPEFPRRIFGVELRSPSQDIHQNG